METKFQSDVTPASLSGISFKSRLYDALGGGRGLVSQLTLLLSGTNTNGFLTGSSILKLVSGRCSLFTSVMINHSQVFGRIPMIFNKALTGLLLCGIFVFITEMP